MAARRHRLSPSGSFLDPESDHLDGALDGFSSTSWDPTAGYTDWGPLVLQMGAGGIFSQVGDHWDLSGLAPVYNGPARIFHVQATLILGISELGVGDPANPLPPLSHAWIGRLDDGPTGVQWPFPRARAINPTGDAVNAEPLALRVSAESRWQQNVESGNLLLQSGEAIEVRYATLQEVPGLIAYDYSIQAWPVGTPSAP